MFISKKKYQDLVFRVKTLEENYYEDKYRNAISELQNKYKIDICLGYFYNSFEIFKNNIRHTIYLKQELTSYKDRYIYATENLEKEIRNILWKEVNK